MESKEQLSGKAGTDPGVEPALSEAGHGDPRIKGLSVEGKTGADRPEPRHSRQDGNAEEVACASVPCVEDLRFMSLALEEARMAYSIGEVPVGAVVVRDGNLVSRGRNSREADRDASAHAEFVAMRRAMEAIDAWRLEGCTVYVTLEPCIMCAGLMQQARIARCVFGAYDPKGGALGTLYSIHGDERLNHRFDATGGVMAEQCGDILKRFFRELRKSR